MGSKSRGDASAVKLRKEHSDAKVDVSILDMADYDSVMAYCGIWSTLTMSL